MAAWGLPEQSAGQTRADPQTLTSERPGENEESAGPRAFIQGATRNRPVAGVDGTGRALVAVEGLPSQPGNQTRRASVDRGRRQRPLPAL